MMEFAEDYRREIVDAFEWSIQHRDDDLENARIAGMASIAEWIRTKLWAEVESALDAGDPLSIRDACARVGLAGLLLRDASDAFGKMLQNAYAGPPEERDERLRAAYVAHVGIPKPDPQAAAS